MMSADLRMGRTPRNFLEAVMAEHQAKRRAEEIAAEERGKRLGIWSPSLNQFVAPSIAERLPSPVLKEVRIKDQAGRVITTFEGTTGAWLRDFMPQPKKVVGIQTR
jgi:hypothetical protein